MIKNFLEWKTAGGFNYKLKLVGETWSGSREIRKMLSIYKDHPSIEFSGYVSKEELDLLYSNASAFIHSSFVEGFGFPVLEAMNYGLPVLCSSGSGTEEISKPYSIVFDPLDKRDFKRSLDKLILKIESGVDYGSIKFSQELMFEQLDTILSKIEKKVYAA